MGCYGIDDWGYHLKGITIFLIRKTSQISFLRIWDWKSMVSKDLPGQLAGKKTRNNSEPILGFQSAKIHLFSRKQPTHILYDFSYYSTISHTYIVFFNHLYIYYNCAKNPTQLPPTSQAVSHSHPPMEVIDSLRRFRDLLPTTSTEEMQMQPLRQIYQRVATTHSKVRIDSVPRWFERSCVV